MKPRNDQAFTLLEIMIVVSVIAIVVAIAAPTWLRQREVSRGKACQENLQKIHHASEQYSMDYRLPEGAPIDYPDDLLMPVGATTGGQGYLRKEPACPSSGTYSITAVGEDPTCSIGSALSPLEPHVLQ